VRIEYDRLAAVVDWQVWRAWATAVSETAMKISFGIFPILFQKLKHNRDKYMKKLLTLTGITSVGAILALMTACQTTSTTQSMSQKETLLAQSGFKAITVTNPKQQQAVNGLAQGRCSAVTYNGKLYYVFPTGTKDKVYVGRQAQFNAYKKAVAAQQASSQTTQQEQQMLHGSPVWVRETAGPHHIEVEEFDGFGPMIPED